MSVEREHIVERERAPEEPRADPKSHYYLQINRRNSRLDDWREIRCELSRGRNLEFVHSPVRDLEIAMIAGPRTAVPTRTIDAKILQLSPGMRSSTHRHSHDAVLFVLEGSGRSVIGDKVVNWGEEDAIHTPAGIFHYHEVDKDARPARFVCFSDAPLVEALRLDHLEDLGKVPVPDDDEAPAPVELSSDESAYGEALRLSRERSARPVTVHTARKDILLRQNPKGTRTALLVDGSLGYETSGLSIAMFEMNPGYAQSNHRHPGEAFLYIVKGKGYSLLDGTRYDWEAGDTVLVHQYIWHQHFNADPDNTALVLRVHMWESLIDIMQATMDPVPMYEDDPEMLKATAGGGVWRQATPGLR